MIKVETKEFVRGNRAIVTSTVTFFNVPIYKASRSTTNNEIIAALSKQEDLSNHIIKGFNNEN